MNPHDRTLPYWSPSRSGYRVLKKVISYTVLILAVLFGVFSCWQWGPILLKKTPVLYAQRKCSGHTLPKGTVIYTEDSEIAAALLRDDKEHYLAISPIVEASVRVRRHLPDYWPTFDRLLDKAYASLFGGLPDMDCILFMHDRTSPSGHTRLIVVGLSLKKDNVPGQTRTTRYALITRVIDKATLNQDAEIRGSDIFGQEDFDIGVLTFYAGECDPLDASKFSIRWDSNGVAHSIQGVLEDDVVDSDIEDFGGGLSVSLRLEGRP